jgi:hypothetical protein
MKSINGCLGAGITLLAFATSASDVIPYSVESIKPIGSGFVELVGPGKIQVDEVALPYDGTKYISTGNIDSLSSVSGLSRGCILYYSSEGYTENISVKSRSCNDVISIIKAAR